MLYTKCIYGKPETQDGTRISVMSNHGMVDLLQPLINGVKRFDEWYKKLAPPESLTRSYIKRAIYWPGYEKGYLDHLKEPERKKLVQDIAKRALFGDITLLGPEEEAGLCYRRLLAEECKKYRPDIRVAHR
jgi:uncharacterized protein YeaO (DUF488 family)